MKPEQTRPKIVMVVGIVLACFILAGAGIYAYRVWFNHDTNSLKSSQDVQNIENEINNQANELDSNLNSETNKLDSVTEEVQ